MGDMDFKIAGSRLGVTAIQLDVKLPGVPLHILCEALAPAQHARCHILDCMEAEIAEPRKEKGDDAPRFGQHPPTCPSVADVSRVQVQEKTTEARVGSTFPPPQVQLPGFGFRVSGFRFSGFRGSERT